MAVCEDACRAKEVTLADLAGVEVQHDLFLVVPDLTAWNTVSGRVAAIGASIESLQISRADAGLSVRCRLSRISDKAARALTTAALDQGTALRGNVEHLVLTTPALRRAS